MCIRDSLAIDIDHHRPFNRWVAEYLTQGGPFASAGDKNAARRFVKQHRRLDQRFMIDILIEGGGLNLAVEDQHAPVKVIVDNLYLLKGCFLGGNIVFQAKHVRR